MEIRTLLRAGIKHRKGSFISVMILAFIIVTTAVAALGVRQNAISAYDRANEEAGTKSVNAIIADRLFTDELFQKLNDSPLTDSVDVSDIVSSYSKTWFPDSDEYTDNSTFFSTLTENIRLYNKDTDGFEENIPPLSQGEIYVPLGLRSRYDCEIGHTVKVEFIDKTREFKVKGFVQEPSVGAMLIGWKIIFVSREEYDMIRSEVSAFESDNKTSLFKLVHVGKADSSLSDAKFQRELNLETSLISKSAGALTLDQSKRYTNLFMIIILDVVLGFVGVLFIIVLVIMIHSIRTEIDMDFENLGILKAQGFTDKTLRRVILLRYIIAELTGMAAGIAASIPLERLLSGIFKNISAILPENRIAIGGALAVIALMIAVSVLAIILTTGKLASISPVRAIAGGRKEIYFAGRLNAPITKRGLSASMAYRAFSSSVGRYIGILFITAALTFFTVTSNVMGAAISSRNALTAMGIGYNDLTIDPKDYDKIVEHIGEIEQIIEEHSPIVKKEYLCFSYFSLNGENIQIQGEQYPENMTGLIKGKQPIYDNEVIITEPVANALDLKMGDKVTVEGKKQKAEYIISGIYQTMNDAGYAAAMSLEGIRKLAKMNVAEYRFNLADPPKRDEIAAELNEKFGSVLQANAVDFEKEMKNDITVQGADAMKLMIYGFSAVFALVAVFMVCSGAFNRERNDFGICKAIGFTSIRLRRQFTVRFMLVSLLGSILGAAAGRLFSLPVLNLVFSMFGITHIEPDNTPMTYIMAALFVCICVTIFAFLASRRIKKVEIRELITE